MHKIVIKCEHMGSFTIKTEHNLETFIKNNVVGNCVIVEPGKKAIPMTEVICIELKQMSTLESALRK